MGQENTTIDTGERVQQMLDGLNSSQRNAVTAPLDSRLQVLAGPGTGKTKTLTSRIAYLLHKGVKPERMIVMTFTNKAVAEMKERITDITGDKGLVSKLQIGTFHSLCVRYLSRFGSEIGIKAPFVVADEQDKKVIMKGVMREGQVVNEMRALGYTVGRYGDFSMTLASGDVKKAPNPDKVGKFISKLKNQGVTAEKFLANEEKSPYTIFYKAYQAHLNATNQLDFDDLLIKSVDLLRAYEKSVENIDTVLVDEFQDSNGIQLELTQLFGQAKNNITVVGDPDQSIYAFRNAQPKNLNLFQDTYKDTQVLYLEENYRSCQPILDFATEFIRQSDDRLGADRKLIGRAGKYDLPSLVGFSNEFEQAKGIAEHTLHLTNGGRVFNFKDMAVLCRTNFEMRTMENAFNLKGVPYIVAGNIKFWERREVKAMLDYLRVISSENDKAAIYRTLNVPKRGFGDTFLTKILTKFQDDKSLFAQLQEVAENPSGDLSKKVGMQTRYVSHLKQYIKLITKCRDMLKNGSDIESVISVVDFINSVLLLHQFFGTSPENEESRLESFDQLKALIHEQNKQRPNELANGGTALELVQNFVINSTLDNVDDDKDEKNRDCVTLSTIHRSKGLEWPVVFVSNCINSTVREDEEEEHRRLVFVAGTRAKSLLYFCYPSELAKNRSLDDKKEEQPLGMLVSKPVRNLIRQVYGDIPQLAHDKLVDYAKFLNRPLPVSKADPPSFTSVLGSMSIHRPNMIQGFQNPLKKQGDKKDNGTSIQGKRKGGPVSAWTPAKKANSES